MSRFTSVAVCAEAARRTGAVADNSSLNHRRGRTAATVFVLALVLALLAAGPAAAATTNLTKPANSSAPGTQISNILVPIPSPVPVNPGPPTISGTPQQGQTLTVTQGPWSNPTSYSYSYTWQRCAGTTCTTAQGPSAAATYLLSSADIGDTIKVLEVATNAGGSGSASSSPTPAITPLPPANQLAPTIGGTTWVGQTLNVTQGTWTNNPTAYSYTWQRCAGTTCINVQGPSSITSYGLTTADLGHTIEVVEEASNAGGPGPPRSSAPTAVITVPPPVNFAAPTISGTSQVGQALSENPGHWTNSPSVTIQWYLCDGASTACHQIPGATGSNLTPATGDVGSMLQVVETATNGGGTSFAYSGFVGPVTAADGVVPPPRSGSLPGVFGTPRQGQTLIAAHASWSDHPSLTDQWFRCNLGACVLIPGATAASYTLTAEDVGDVVHIQETAHNAGGDGQATSSNSALITAPSATWVQLTPASPTSDQAVTLVGTVTSAAGQHGPSGTLSFFSGNSPIPGCGQIPVAPRAQSVTLTCQAFFTASAVISASFSAAAGSLVDGSSSAAMSVSVGRAATELTLQTPLSVEVGARASYRATISVPVAVSGAPLPAGAVTFLDGGQPIPTCVSRPLVKATATCSVKPRRGGQHEISARYSGSSSFLAAVAPRQPLFVGHPPASGFVTAYLAWTFNFTPFYTRVMSLQASQLGAHSSIAIVCRGHGCPFVSRTVVLVPHCIRRHSGRHCTIPSAVNLTTMFHGRQLRRGAQVTISIVHRGWLGKYYEFRVRPRKQPQIVVGCLPVGATRPGAGCTGA